MDKVPTQLEDVVWELWAESGNDVMYSVDHDKFVAPDSNGWERMVIKKVFRLGMKERSNGQ
jgi:hypothetical protein